MAVELAGYGWTPPGAERAVLAGVDLQLARGECALLRGPTGSGKSTLLRAIAGALPRGGAETGRRRVEGRAVLLLQDVETQLLFSTVEEEVASGLRGAAERGAGVAAALARAGLRGLADRPTSDLSGGERQRVVLAALLAGEPSLLLLDEPTSALDPSARAQLVALLERLKHLGHTLLVAEHATACFRGIADRWLLVERGRVVERALPPPPRRPAAPGTRNAVAALPVLLRARGIRVSDAGGRDRLAALDLEVRRGDALAVYGPNGAGKTTLLHVLAGLVRPSHGDLELVAGGSARERLPGSRPGRVALVLQSPPRNLFARSVGEELAFTLERAGASPERVAGRVTELLDAFGLARYRDTSPLRISFGEQHCVAIAAALASEPALLLLDEPFAGLDASLRRGLLERLERERARTGMAVVVACHDPAGLDDWPRRSVHLPPPSPAPPAVAPAPAQAPPGRVAHYRATGSPLHRLGVGWKLAGVALGCAAAIAARSPLALAALLGVWAAGYRTARLGAAELWQDARWLLAQGVVIVALSLLRGGVGGAESGLRAAVQIALFFLPGALLLRTTSTGRLLDSVRRVLPEPLAFALATSLRFAPFFSRELHEIVGVQRLRGARLAPRELWRPRAWRDAIECAGVPLAVRSIHAANEVALAAEVRGVVSPAITGGRA